MNKKEFLTDEELEELLDLQTEIFDDDAAVDFCNLLVEISPEDMTNAPLPIKLIWFVRCSFLEGFRRALTVVNDALKDDDSDCDSGEEV